jgi:hypothetical protein
MSELERDARALMRAGRSAFRPDTADRDRVYGALTAALAESGSPPGGRPGTGRAAGPSHLTAWIAGGLATVTVGAGLAVLAHLHAHKPSAARPASETTLSAPIASPPAAPAPSSEERSPAVEGQPVVAGAGVARPSTRSSARAPSDSLSEEVRLLSRAEEQLNGGLAEDALKTLAEHERRFSAGALAEERMAAQVQALCALGRTAEAKSDLTRLMHAYPRSAHLDRARRVCGIDVGSSQ